MDNMRLVERLVAWVVEEDGAPGAVPTRYAGEIALPAQPETADLRVAVRQAFVDGMMFNDALADAANHHRV